MRDRVRLPQRVRATSLGALLEATMSYAPTIHGRASRVELIVTILAAVMLGSIAAELSNAYSDALTVPGNVLLALLVAAPILSVMIRRAHDVGSDGAVLFLVLVPYLGIFWLIYILLKPSVYDD